MKAHGLRLAFFSFIHFTSFSMNVLDRIPGSRDLQEKASITTAAGGEDHFSDYHKSCRRPHDGMSPAVGAIANRRDELMDWNVFGGSALGCKTLYLWGVQVRKGSRTHMKVSMWDT